MSNARPDPSTTAADGDFMEHVIAYELDHGWYAWPGPGSLAAAAAGGQFKTALQLRRKRRDSTLGRRRVDLDRRWRAALLALVWVAALLGSFLFDARVEAWTFRHESLSLIGMLASLFVTVYLGKRAANAEMRAAAEAAVRAGYRKRST
jgi:hypothetical protein